jgi:hypothetical protein
VARFSIFIRHKSGKSQSWEVYRRIFFSFFPWWYYKSITYSITGKIKIKIKTTQGISENRMPTRSKACMCGKTYTTNLGRGFYGTAASDVLENEPPILPGGVPSLSSVILLKVKDLKCQKSRPICVQVWILLPHLLWASPPVAVNL